MASLISATTVNALLTRATAESARGEHGAATSLIDYLRQQFTNQSGSLTAIDGALREHSPTTSSQLAGILDEQAHDDPTFWSEIQGRLTGLQAAATESASVTNTVVGDISGPLVQARDVFGGITFHDSAPWRSDFSS
jgi:hypothetical protein